VVVHNHPDAIDSAQARCPTQPQVGDLTASLRGVDVVLRSWVKQTEIDQAVRRVLREEQVPAAEKALSLFEEHTMIIARRKVGKPREYGPKVLIDEVDGGLISRYEVLSEAGREHPHLPESIEGHRERFGRAPELLAADRGLYSKANEEAAKKAGIRRVALPQSGRPTKKRTEYEQQRWFRRAFAFRAGVEGRISVLRRKYGLERCPYHGEDGMGRWVGWGG
jgi:IS5 family transposase